MGASVSLPYGEEADSFYIERRECLSSIYREESVSPLYRRERGPFSLYKSERVYLFSIERRQTHGGETLSIPLTEKGPVSSLSRREILFPLHIQGLCLLSIETRKRLFSISEKERGQDKAGAGARQTTACQGREREAKTRARQALPGSCLALSGESLLSIETIKRLFSCIGKERDGKARQGQGQGKPRQALPVSCLALPRGVSLFSIEPI